MTVSLSRAQLFSRGAKGGAALLLAGSVAGSFAGSASADAIPDADLAYARLLVGAEVLPRISTRGRSRRDSSSDTPPGTWRALFNERSTTGRWPGSWSARGSTPAAAADFDFSYPKRSFVSKTSIAGLGIKLETTFLGAYLGAVCRVLQRR